MNKIMNEESKKEEFIYLVSSGNGTLRITATKIIFDEHGLKFFYEGNLIAFITYQSLFYLIENKNE